MHLLKGNIGCGMLAMGDAFRNGGLLMAPILTVFIGFVCIYNNHILVRGLAKPCGLPRFFKILMNGTINQDQCGVPTLFYYNFPFDLGVKTYL